MSSQRYQRVSSPTDYKSPMGLYYVSRRSILTVAQVNHLDDDDDDSNNYQQNRSQLNSGNPTSPPPSFRSRSSSHSSRRLLHDESNRNDADRTLADTFDDGSDSEGDDEPDDRQRLMRANPQPHPPADSGNAAPSSSTGNTDTQQGQHPSAALQRRPTEFPTLSSAAAAPGRVISSSNDGVFANLAAKPVPGEKNEDLPPVCAYFLVLCI